MAAPVQRRNPSASQPSWDIDPAEITDSPFIWPTVTIRTASGHNSPVVVADQFTVFSSSG